MTVTKTGAFSHDADIREQTDDNAGTNSDAINRSNNWFGAIQHFIDDVAGFLQDRDNLFIIPMRIPDPVEVTARRERPPGPGQYDHARFRIAVDHRPEIRQSLMHLGVGRIQLLGLAQSYPENSRIAAFKYHVWERRMVHGLYIPLLAEERGGCAEGAPASIKLSRHPSSARRGMFLGPIVITLKYVARLIHPIYRPQLITDFTDCGVGFDSVNQCR